MLGLFHLKLCVGGGGGGGGMVDFFRGGGGVEFWIILTPLPP